MCTDSVTPSSSELTDADLRAVAAALGLTDAHEVRQQLPDSERHHNHVAIAAAAGRIVNAIPAVVAALPGIRTTLDLPLITGPSFDVTTAGIEAPATR